MECRDGRRGGRPQLVWLLVFLSAVLLCPACTGELVKPPVEGGVSDASRDGSHDAPQADGPRDGGPADLAKPQPDAPPFACTLPAVSPTLALVARTHPGAVRAGQALTVALHSGNTAPNNAPALELELTDAAGQRTLTPQARGGGGQASWFFTAADLPAGEACLVVRRVGGGAVELAQKIDVLPAQAQPRGNGVWKVKSHHQWRCDEQPTNGNGLIVEVRDEQGKGVAGATVRLRVSDDTVFPVKPDTSATNWADHAHPKSMTTDGNGRAELTTPWGWGIRTPIDGRPSWLIFLVSIDGGASDTATEITTGLWETDAQGCNYCSKSAVNVYGHWSYTVTFQRDPTATEICDVGTDHAGQSACTHEHLYHHPTRPSCQPVAP